MMRIVLGATGALALGLLTLVLVTMGVFSSSSVNAETGVNDPTPGSVFQVAVDMDTTGNPTGAGGLLSAVDATSSLPVGGQLEIDVIIDEVAAADGIGAFGFNLLYDPNVMMIISKDFNSFMLPSAFEIIPAPIPDSSGNWRLDAGALFVSVDGEGVLVRIGIECLDDGQSSLELADDTNPGSLSFKKPTGDILPVDNRFNGEIVCGTGSPDTPTPTPGGTDTDTPTPPTGATDTPTPTPTLTDAPSPTDSPTDTPVATPTDTSAPTAAPTSAPADTATPATLPPTGGSEGGPSLPWIVWLMLAAGLLFTSLGIAAVARSQARTRV